MQNETRSIGNAECKSEEKNSRNTNRNQSISQRQEESNNPTNNREVGNTKDSDRTLLQNGQKQGNSESRNMEEIKGDIESRQPIRQASDGVLREGDGIRDDKESLQLREDKPDNSNIRYFSMFTGIGGFERGFERASDKVSDGIREREEGHGESETPIKSLQESNESTQHSRDSPSINGRQKKFRCIGMSEFDKYSSQVLKHRFPNITNWGDCTKINPRELPDFDMLCGGFPCQAFSIAGKRRGFEDTRGTMFFEIARILEVKRPKIILLENVKGLLNHNKGETFRVILQTLDELGYEIQWMVLNSKFFGVPQNRERVLIVGNLRGTSRSEILPFRQTSDESNKGNSEEQNASSLQHPGHSGGNYKGMNMVKTRYPLRFQGRNQRNMEGDYSFTVDSCHTGGIKEGTSIRRLTPVECCRLQGFPDDWNGWGIDDKGNKVKMSDTQRYKQMGNAVTTNVIAAIGSQFLNKGKEE